MKSRVLSVVFLILFMTGIVIFALKAGSDDAVNEKESYLSSKRGTMAWLTAFASKDYDTCDNMVLDDSDKFYSGQVVANIIDNKYYKYALDSLVNNILTIKVKSIEKDKKSGVLTYTVSVTYNTVKPIAELTCNKNTLSKAKDLYRGKKISDTDFQEKLSQVYFNIFKENCFNVGEDTHQQDLTLSEKKSDGVAYVDGTVSFIDSILSDSGITKNMEIYEQEVKESVDSLIREE